MTRLFCRNALAVLAVLFGQAAVRPADADAPIRTDQFKRPIRVACVGDSITAGAGAAPGQAYPAQLGRMLGRHWEVKNFGVSGRTLLKKGDYPYWKETAFRQARKFEPDVVVIMLGTNDTKPQNWKHHDEFAEDYKDLVRTFEHLPSKPHVFVCLPPPVPGRGNYGINEVGVQKEFPIIKQVARETDAGLINMHAPFEDRPQLLPDRVHPNTEGAKVMAETVYEKLTGNRPGK